MACTPAEAYWSMAMLTNTNKSCTEIHTISMGASNSRSDRHRRVKSLRTVWVVVMGIYLSVGARSGGPPPTRIKPISRVPRTVKLTGRLNSMESSLIWVIIRLRRRAILTSRVMAESFSRKGLNQPTGSRSWPKRPSSSRNSRACSTSKISSKHPNNTLGRTIFRAAGTPTLSRKRSTEPSCSSSTATQSIYLSKFEKLHIRPLRAMRLSILPRLAAPANLRQLKRLKHTLVSPKWINSSYKTIRVWCLSITSNRTQSLWKCRTSWAWRRQCQLLGPQQSIKLLQSSTQQSRTPQSTRARSRRSHSNHEKISMNRTWWPRCK